MVNLCNYLQGFRKQQLKIKEKANILLDNMELPFPSHAILLSSTLTIPFAPSVLHLPAHLRFVPDARVTKNSNPLCPLLTEVLFEGTPAPMCSTKCP